MAAEPRQLVLELPHRAALEASDFFVSPANSLAVALVDQWPDWVHWAALVVGPSGCGKSHLANVWRFKSGADVVCAAQLDDRDVGRFQSSGALVVEDIDGGIRDERVLFHLLNLARQDKTCILMTSRVAAGELRVELPDLRSRLRALPFAAIDEPDQALLTAVLVKLFADRQLKIEPPVIDFLLVRIERSMAAANQIVDAIDRLALETHRRVTRHLASRALERLGL